MKTIQLNPLKYPVYVMLKPAGSSCNLSCSYCYYLEKGNYHSTSQVNQMSEKMLEIFTEQYINAQPGEQVLFTWHGGEPLILGLDYYRKAIGIQKKFKNKYHIDNVLQTNGTLLTEDWCFFFKDNNILIGLSLDGPEHCHDHYRKNSGGKGSFLQTMKGLELLKKNGVDFNILSVVNDYNVRFPLEIYHFFKSNEINYIQFSPVVERIDSSTGFLKSAVANGNNLTEWSVPSMEYGKFLNTIFEEWVRQDVGQTFVTIFDATLAGYVGVSPGICIFSETCGHAGAIEANGDLYACDHFVFPEFKLGNIREKTITEMMLSKEQFQFGNDKKSKLSETCLRCKYLSVCNGECPKNRFVTLPGEKMPQNYLCPGLKLYYNQTEPYMQFMANEILNGNDPAIIMQNLFNSFQNND